MKKWFHLKIKWSKILRSGICQWKWDTHIGKLDSNVLTRRLIDPCCRRWQFGNRNFVFEPIRVFVKGSLQNLGSLIINLLCHSVVKLLGSHQSNTGMAMFFVIPIEKWMTEIPGILNRSEPVGKLRTILQGFELRFGIRIVIAHVRPTVCFSDSQISQKMRNHLWPHAGSPVGMHRELAGFNVLLDAAFFDKPFG